MYIALGLPEGLFICIGNYIDIVFGNPDFDRAELLNKLTNR